RITAMRDPLTPGGLTPWRAEPASRRGEVARTPVTRRNGGAAAGSRSTRLAKYDELAGAAPRAPERADLLDLEPSGLRDLRDEKVGGCPPDGLEIARNVPLLEAIVDLCHEAAARPQHARQLPHHPLEVEGVVQGVAVHGIHRAVREDQGVE